MGTFKPTTVIMLSLLLSLTVVSAATLQDKVVTPHWEAACNTSLLFSEREETWEDASGECKLYGGNLVQIRSMEMNYCILRHAHSKGLPAGWYWHSGNDIDEEGVYRYNRAGDFSPIAGDLILWSPIGWYSGRPDSGEYQNCLDVNLSRDKYAGQWDDGTCTIPLRYICQRKL